MSSRTRQVYFMVIKNQDQKKKKTRTVVAYRVERRDDSTFWGDRKVILI